jgi:hypothetical protein
MIISFGWTTPALLAGEKTETRREWNRVYLLQMQAAWRKGQRVHDAWNTTPRNIRHEPRPGKIARIELTAMPQIETIDLVDEGTWAREGLEYLTVHGYLLDGLTPMQLWTHWLEADPHLVVVRFKLLELTPYGRELRALQALKVPA